MSRRLVRILQKALDQRNENEITKIMTRIYPDYITGHEKTLIAYNEECNIKAADLIRFKTENFPETKYLTLFCFEENLIQNLCCRTKEELEKILHYSKHSAIDEPPIIEKTPKKYHWFKQWISKNISSKVK